MLIKNNQKYIATTSHLEPVCRPQILLSNTKFVTIHKQNI